MKAIITPHSFSGNNGTARIPASKSHTIRRLIIAALTDGVSRIEMPLSSLDTLSCLSVCRALGADVSEDSHGWTVKGIVRKENGSFDFTPRTQALDVGNSGTTLFLAISAAALGDAPITFTGDEQIKRRSAAELLSALRELGVMAESAPDGCAPITVRGPWKGGACRVECQTSQYLSALLIAAPLAPCVTEIAVPILNEKPYIEMTLSYLDRLGVSYKADADFSRFKIKGGTTYHPLQGAVPADFSSAAFPAAAALVSGGTVSLAGLDPNDTQGDKAFFDMVKRMGAEIEWRENAADWELVVQSRPLKGGVFDLNATPDLLPVMAVMAAFAQGETRLVNAAHARIKETDRIAVMAAELGKLGVSCAETPDGLVIQGRGAVTGGAISGGAVDGHGDHRIVMALAAAALGASAPVVIDGAEAARVTYPEFLRLIGAEEV